MKKLFILLACSIFTLCINSQSYTPFKLQRNNNLDLYNESISQLNKQRQMELDNIYNYIKLATSALDSKNYSKAEFLFGSALQQINKGGFRGEIGEDLVSRIEELIDYCSYKKNNPYENPLYKINIGSIFANLYFYDVYAYGIENSIVFFIFQIGNLESIMIPLKSINEFTQILEDLYLIGQKMNSSAKKPQKYPRVFPFHFYAYYTDKAHNMGLHEKCFTFNIAKNSSNKNTVTMNIDTQDYPILIFNSDDLMKLSTLISSLQECEKVYQNNYKEKVTDDDYFLNLLSNDLWQRIKPRN